MFCALLSTAPGEHAPTVPCPHPAAVVVTLPFPYGDTELCAEHAGHYPDNPGRPVTAPAPPEPVAAPAGVQPRGWFAGTVA